MTSKRFFNEDYLLWEALLVSLGMHFLLLHMGSFTLHVREKHTVEIDITTMGRVAMAPAPPKPAPPRNEWVKPRPEQKIIPTPVPTKPIAPEPEPPPPVLPPIPQEYAMGTGEATTLSRLPQLLNLSDLRAILRRYYPEEARSQGRGATVILDIHIDTEGHVKAVDITQSGGADFDEAARKAVALLRFTPAFLGSQRVAVKMRQAIHFKLEN